MARVAVLITLSLVLVVAGMVTIAHRIARDARRFVHALATAAPSPPAFGRPDAGLTLGDAGAASVVARDPVRAARLVVEASAAPAPTLLDVMVARVCPTASRLLDESHARCGCADPEPELRASLEEACADWMEAALRDRAWESLEPDDGRIARCLDGIEAARDACWVDLALEECSDLVREPVALGERCDGAGSRCREGVCAETCRRAPREGEPAVAGLCDAGLIVDLNETCARPLREGDPCRGLICEADLYCDGFACRRVLGAGEACSITYECAGGLLCEGGACAAPPIWCEDGDECGWAYECDVTWLSRCVRSPGASGERECEDGRTVCGDDWSCEEQSLGGRCAPDLCGHGELVSLFTD